MHHPFIAMHHPFIAMDHPFIEDEDKTYTYMVLAIMKKQRQRQSFLTAFCLIADTSCSCIHNGRCTMMAVGVKENQAVLRKSPTHFVRGESLRRKSKQLLLRLLWTNRKDCCRCTSTSYLNRWMLRCRGNAQTLLASRELNKNLVNGRIRIF